MKRSFRKLFGGVLLFSLSMSLTSCEDIFGHWEKPTPVIVTPGTDKQGEVTSVTLDKTELALTIGGAAVQLTATVTPDNATDADVDWSSSDVSVATVDGSGLVTAVAMGTATITAKAGDKSASCTVTVTEVYTAKDYKEGSWDGTKVVFTKQTAASVTAVANSDADVTWSAGWYTVSGNVTITGKVTLGADTHLILQDGATLNCQKIDFSNSSGYTLYIYGQDKGDGKLNISCSTGGAMWDSNKGEIVIHGGEITAESTSSRGLVAKGIRVYGGKLTATSTVGDGIQFYNDNFEVYGGEVEGESTNNTSNAIYSNSNPLEVYGGKVKATGGASGIGFSCKLLSGTDGIKFYFSTDGTTWSSGTGYGIATTAPTNRYAKAE